MPLLNFQIEFAPAVIAGMRDANRIYYNAFTEYNYSNVMNSSGLPFFKSEKDASIFEHSIHMSSDNPKRQTIRAMRKHSIKVGDTLYLYTGARTKNCKKLGEVKCKAVYTIVINCNDYTIEYKDEISYMKISNSNLEALLRFANADGFKTHEELFKFFKKNKSVKNGVFAGQLIMW